MNDPERWEPSSTVTLAQLYQEHVDLAFPALKRSTQYDMKVMLHKHVFPSLGSFPIDRLNRDGLQDHFNRLMKRGVSWDTARKLKAYVSSVLREPSRTDG